MYSNNMPGPLKTANFKPPIHEQIAGLQRKIQLLEGDRSSYYESSQSTIRKNKETILHLREENKKLYKKLSDNLAGDEQLIKKVFQSRGKEKVAFRNKSAKEALVILDHKVCDKLKKLNALKHSTETRRRRLADLQLLCKKAEAAAQAAQHDAENKKAKSEGEAAEEQPQKNLLMLENQLEKTQLKCQEAEQIMRSYLKLKDQLQEESLTFQPQLDNLEAQILRQRQELRELQTINTDAQLSKDAAKEELQQQEELMYKGRREREHNLNQYKKMVEERKAQAEKLERKHAAMQQEEPSALAKHSSSGVAEEEKVISMYEEAFQHIKEATGVTDMQEVVERFVSQGSTQKHLEILKNKNEEEIQKLKEERDKILTQFQEVKYSGEAKLSSEQKLLEECEASLQREQEQRDKAKAHMEWLTNTLNVVRSGVEHLCDKLQHINLKDQPVTQLAPTSDEYILELLRQAELKLQRLQDELQGKDVDAIMKEMEEEEFRASMEGKLPPYNTRIKLPEIQKQDPFEDEEESEDEEVDIITRATLKRQSQMIIDAKTKRRTRIKKKKNKS